MSAILSVLILGAAFSVVPHLAIQSRQDSRAPVPVRIVIYGEIVYGVGHLLFVPTLLLPSIFGFVPLSVGEITFALRVFVGMVWLVIAVNLQHGDRKSRNALLTLSLIRASDLRLGLLISFISILLLFGPVKSRHFFDEG